MRLHKRSVLNVLLLYIRRTMQFWSEARNEYNCEYSDWKIQVWYYNTAHKISVFLVTGYWENDQEAMEIHDYSSHQFG